MKFEKWLFDRDLLYPLIDLNESFYSILEIARIVNCNNLPYAGVGYSEKDDTISFLVNESNFDILDKKKQLFIIMHEILHLAYDHLARIKYLTNRTKANLAADCVVNGDLVEYFNFSKDEIDPENNLIWPESFKLPRGLDMESYYHMIPNSADFSTLDSHDFWEMLPDKIKNKIQQVFEEIEKFKSIKDNAASYQAGTNEPVGNFVVEKVNFPIPKINWGSIIKHLTKSCIAAKDADRVRWDRKNRRYANFNDDIYLPTEIETETFTISKSLAYIYMDVSGSCIDDKDYIYAIMRKIPYEFFVCKVFTFNTTVSTPRKLEGGRYEIFGGGGTCFKTISDHVSKQERKPDIVFVITDGHGTNVSPDEPEKWVWILTTEFNNYIPQESKQVFVKKVR